MKNAAVRDRGHDQVIVHVDQPVRRPRRRFLRPAVAAGRGDRDRCPAALGQDVDECVDDARVDAGGIAQGRQDRGTRPGGATVHIARRQGLAQHVVQGVTIDVTEDARGGRAAGGGHEDISAFLGRLRNGRNGPAQSAGGP